MAGVLRRSNRVLLGLTVGAIVFASTFAAAASLGLTVETLSADQVAIVSCDADGITSDYTTVYSASAGGYVVDDVNLSGIDADCNGLDFKVTLVGGAGASLAEEVTAAAALGGTGDARTLSSEFSTDNVLAENVVALAVSITDPS